MLTTILPLRHGAKGAFSITHDDGAPGQYNHAAKILSANDLRGTFYVIGASINSWYADSKKQLPDWKLHLPQVLAMRDMGHEIACHTYNHKSLTAITEQEVHDQFALNRDYFAKWGFKLFGHAYPYGDTNASVQSIAAQYVRFARGVDTLKPNPVVWSQLNPMDIATTANAGLAKVRKSIDDAIMGGTWSVATVHGVGEVGWSVADYTELCAYAAQKVAEGDLWAGTFSEVGQYLLQKSTATTTEKAVAGGLSVSLKTTGPLDFIVPMTLRTEVALPVSGVSQSGMSVPWKMVEQAVQYDATPNAGDVVIAYGQA